MKHVLRPLLFDNHHAQPGFEINACDGAGVKMGEELFLITVFYNYEMET
jgi:hypothetical protein